MCALSPCDTPTYSVDRALPRSGVRLPALQHGQPGHAGADLVHMSFRPWIMHTGGADVHRALSQEVDAVRSRTEAYTGSQRIAIVTAVEAALGFDQFFFFKQKTAYEIWL